MASDYYGQDNDKSYQKTVAMCVAAASLVILLFLVVLYVNSDDKKDDKPSASVSMETEEEDDILKDSHNITSSELDFWKDEKKPLPLPKEEEGELTPYRDGDDAEEGSGSEPDLDKDKESSKPKRDDDSEGEGSLNRESDDIKDKEGYIAITDEKGSTRYYELLTDVPKNEYDLENSLINENGFLTYKDSKRESIRGVDLSKYNGTVDFAKLKENGIGFAMLRLGSRGYGTGNITLDEKFVEYAQNAQLAGIQIGAYFYSQAVNETEAVEEANYIVGAVSSFNVRYPIAIDVEKVKNDEARTDKLTAEERTAIVKMFCDTVKGYGYKPIIYATKDMLVSGLELDTLADYDVWLADETVPTDYPYRYSMWQYSTKGRIDGITGDIDFDISFIDYEKR
ncbi:MAG: glycoside hydrolase family 25 protein [Lachnospiraceae bacterium]|nr:glycoside hydrolase family 25 protein [Lachnospiraceae bacterium]